MILFIFIKIITVRKLNFEDVGYLTLFSVIPLLAFVPGFINFRTRPKLEIYKDRVINTSFGKTTEILIEDIEFLRRHRGSFSIVLFSGKKCMSPMLYGIRQARELLQELTGRELYDEKFVDRKRAITITILIGAPILFLIQMLIFALTQ